MADSGVTPSNDMATEFLQAARVILCHVSLNFIYSFKKKNDFDFFINNRVIWYEVGNSDKM